MIRASKPISDDSNRRSLEAIAYRMLGSWADAEDIAQESLTRWHSLSEAEQAQIREPLAWLSKVATRRCLDLMKSARKQREVYVGPWLPEPILTEAPDPAKHAELDDSIHLALMLALERLSAAERAAFLLHDVFGYTFDQVAEMLDKSAAACRQLASRARSSIQTERARFEFDADAHQRLLKAFLDATNEGDATALAQLLADDVTLYSDGGGVVPAARKILRTREIVSRLFLGLAKKFRDRGVSKTPRFHSLNGLPSALLFQDGKLDTTLSISVSNGRIQAIYQQRNPAKLASLFSQLPSAPTPEQQR